jgi:alanine-glyoxylate transaminase/serine-glyoxylate transaminase/serine-pyruvate transaminase
MTERARLMIPGPVDVEDDVLAAMAEPTLPHYGKLWLDVYNETVDLLKHVFGTRHDVLIMSGPGTVGLEAAMGSLLRAGDPVLIPHNGFFGRRMGIVAQGLGLDVRTVEGPLGQALDPEAVRQALLRQPEIEALVVVHLETSTGVLNPLRELAAVARERDVCIIVDAVSSLGGVPLPVDEWDIDVCVTVANKCLGCPPGLTLLSVGPRAWEQMARRPDRSHGWYVNLEVWKQYAHDWPWHPYPVTLPTNNIVALRTSLRHVVKSGLGPTYARFARSAGRVRSGLRGMGFEIFAAECCVSPLVTAVHALPGMDVPDLQRYLMKERGIMIAGGLDELAGKIFRVGHIGKAASDEYTEAFLDGVAAYRRLPGQE